MLNVRLGCNVIGGQSILKAVDFFSKLKEKCIYLFVYEVGGCLAEVNFLIPPGTEAVSAFSVVPSHQLSSLGWSQTAM